jgi:hypothetical protein
MVSECEQASVVVLCHAGNVCGRGRQAPQARHRVTLPTILMEAGILGPEFGEANAETSGYGNEYVTPVVNWNEFFRKLGGGSLRKVSSALTFRLTRLYSAIVTLAPPLAE